MKRVLLADADVVVLSALGLLLRRKLGIPEICEVGNADQVIECIAKFRPDMLLLDWNLPDLDITRLRAELQRYEHQPIVIVMSLDTEDEKKALSGGVDGFLNKHASGNCVVELLKRYMDRLPDLVEENHVGGTAVNHS